MTKTKIILLSGVAIFGFSGLALAGPKADLNQDGQVTQSEFMAHAEAKFQSTDFNQDGYLSEDERQQARDQRKSEKQAERFVRADANGDGVISEDEHAALKGRKGPRGAEAGGKRSKKGPRGGKRAEAKVEVDLNGDGLISFQEHMTGAEKKFVAADTNANGILEEGEGRRGPRKGKRSR